jgi:hypothetical protein
MIVRPAWLLIHRSLPESTVVTDAVGAAQVIKALSALTANIAWAKLIANNPMGIVHQYLVRPNHNENMKTVVKTTIATNKPMPLPRNSAKATGATKYVIGSGGAIDNNSGKEPR